MSPRHILVLKPSSLGDIIHTLPAVAALRERFPDARITWLVNPEWAPLLDGNPDISGTLIFPRDTFRGPAGWARFVGYLRQLPRETDPDLIADFQGLLRTGLIARALRPAPMIGLSDAREGARLLQTRTVEVGATMHAVERYLALAAALGAGTAKTPAFPLPPGTRPTASLPEEPFIVLHPFSRGRGKSLAPEVAATFCRAVKRPVILVGRSEERLATTPGNVVNLLNQTSLHELLWLLRHAAAVVSVDSGPSHLAAAVSRDLLSIHTWSDPCAVGPYRPGASVWRGGTIYPALDPDSSAAEPREPTAADAEAMAAHITERVAARQPS